MRKAESSFAWRMPSTTLNNSRGRLPSEVAEINVSHQHVSSLGQGNHVYSSLLLDTWWILREHLLNCIEFWFKNKADEKAGCLGGMVRFVPKVLYELNILRGLRKG